MRVDTDSFACTELPAFMEKTEVLKDWISGLPHEQQKALWACNDKIARQNAERFAHMNLRKNLSPALLAYDGIQYTYMVRGGIVSNNVALHFVECPHLWEQYNTSCRKSGCREERV